MVITSTKNSYRYCSVRPAQNRCHTLTSLGSSCETRERGKNGRYGAETPVPKKPWTGMTAEKGAQRIMGTGVFGPQRRPGSVAGFLEVARAASEDFQKQTFFFCA